MDDVFLIIHWTSSYGDGGRGSRNSERRKSSIFEYSSRIFNILLLSHSHGPSGQSKSRGQL